MSYISILLNTTRQFGWDLNSDLLCSSFQWSVGDRVEICVPLDILQQLQHQHGGWNHQMGDAIGKIGVVHRITENGDVRVNFTDLPDNKSRFTFNPLALAKVAIAIFRPFFVGVSRITDQQFSEIFAYVIEYCFR